MNSEKAYSAAVSFGKAGGQDFQTKKYNPEFSPYLYLTSKVFVFSKGTGTNVERRLIGHFRVRLSLSFKASLSAKFLLW